VKIQLTFRGRFTAEATDAESGRKKLNQSGKTLNLSRDAHCSITSLIVQILLKLGWLEIRHATHCQVFLASVDTTRRIL